MKSKLLIIIISVYILDSCTNETKSKFIESQGIVPIDSINYRNTHDTIFVDKACVGMTISKLKTIYKDLIFVEEPMFFYGIDSEAKGLLLKKDKKPFIFVWTKENSDTINGITILTDQIIIDKDVHVGITVKDFFDKYKNAKLQIDAISNETEFGFVMNGLNYRVEFLTTDSSRVGLYDINQVEPEFIKLKRLDAKVDRIGVYN